MSIGEKVRRIRLTQGLSMRELAKQVGVSPSLISQIERNQVSPSYSTLKGLARALSEDPSSLIDERAPLEWLLVKKDARRNVYTGQEGVALELFAFPGPRDRRMEVYMVTLEPGAVFVADMLYSDRFSGQDDFIYVIAGTVNITTDRRSMTVQHNEACYLTYENIQSLTNSNQIQTKLIWCIHRIL
ncbi:MAG: helix-turn-helix domain-containing protein [Bacillota bacterium]|jgi:transcriptional regulator with XRE-family HTH domain|nr:helix-turn-helix transcriptional regulator [Candidatus Fermentithermobacillaceae bacterium]